MVHSGLCWVYVALDGEAATRDVTRDAGNATRDAARDAGDATGDATKDALCILCIQARMCSFKYWDALI